MGSEILITAASTLGGVGLGLWGSALLERSRWRRDWTITRAQEIKAYATEALTACHAVYVLHGVCQTVLRQGMPLPADRLSIATDAWRTALSRSLTAGSHALQLAMSEFDTAREQSVNAINEVVQHAVTTQTTAVVSQDAVAQADRRMNQARLAVLDAWQADANAINGELALYVVPLYVRFWKWLRGQPVAPVAPLPSTTVRQPDDPPS